MISTENPASLLHGFISLLTGHTTLTGTYRPCLGLRAQMYMLCNAQLETL